MNPNLSQEQLPSPSLLRHYITTMLITEALSTRQLAARLNQPLGSVREQCFILRTLDVICRIGFVEEDHFVEQALDPYYWDSLWELTEHGRSHSSRYQSLHCRGCRLQRLRRWAT